MPTNGRFLTAIQRLEIVAMLDNHIPTNEIAEKFGISKPAISRVKKYRKEIKQYAMSGGNMNTQRIKSTSDLGLEVDMQVYEW
jgi:uncharacterized protein YerC